jgi:hypothetical protein
LEIFDRIVNDRHAVLAEQSHERGTRDVCDLRCSADPEAFSTDLLDRPEATKLKTQQGHVLPRDEVWRNLDLDRDGRIHTKSMLPPIESPRQ